MSVEDSKKQLRAHIPLILDTLEFDSFSVFTALDGALLGLHRTLY